MATSRGDGAVLFGLTALIIFLSLLFQTSLSMFDKKPYPNGSTQAEGQQPNDYSLGLSIYTHVIDMWTVIVKQRAVR